jgi:hypothetical protein
MISDIYAQHNPNKYARLTKRAKLSFPEIDERIKQKLISLEIGDANLWTNPRYNKDEFVHSIFAYPAMMVPEVQRQIIDVIFANSGSQHVTSLLDPFMGSSTSLISGMHYGIDCYGQDINPLAILISKVRTTLVDVNFTVLRKKNRALLKQILEDDSDRLEVKFKGIDKWFKLGIQIELSKIVRAIKAEEDIRIRRFYWANLAEVIRNCSNDRTSTYKLHMRSMEQIEARENSALVELKKHLKQSLESYWVFKSFLRKKGRLSAKGYRGNINIQYGNSVENISFAGRKDFADLLVSSPPYGDNHTTVPYGQYSFLQLQWVDLADIEPDISPDCLISTAKIDSDSVGGKRSDKALLEKAAQICALSESFNKDCANFSQLSKDRFNKIVVFLYDLNKVIDNSLAALKDNSYLVWTMGDRSVGNGLVRNVQYLKELLENKGCVFVHSITRTILNKRMAQKNNNTNLMNSEEIIIFRKAGIKGD